MLQFDLEQQIMNCWSVVDDIKGLLQMQDLRSMTEDEHQNYLLGLATIYQVKFELLQDLFERFMAEYYAAKKSESEAKTDDSPWPFSTENPSY